MLEFVCNRSGKPFRNEVPMNERETKMRARLAVLEPVQLEIIDDSHKHAGHAGAREGGGHYMLRIVSAQFAGKNTVARHRMIYSAMGDLMKREIHALTLQALAPDEL
jgi:BolA protein